MFPLFDDFVNIGVIQSVKVCIAQKAPMTMQCLCLILRLCHKDIVKITHYWDILLFTPCNVDIQFSNTAVND